MVEWLRRAPTALVGGAAASLLVSAWASACSDSPLSLGEDFGDEPAPEVQPEYVAFMDVNLVPMDSERVLGGQTVLVHEGRIEAVGDVGSVDIPDGAFRIDGQGRYLMPGLADKHVHTTSQTFANLRNDFVLYLANGVTTVRVMWGSRGVIDERGRIEAGEVLGPSLLVASPGLDGPGGTWTASTPPVGTPAEARERVTEHVAAGYDFIKVYNDLSRDSYEAIVDEAAALGIPVVGHVPSAVGVERVQEAGQLTLEHFIGFKLVASNPFTGGILNTERIRDLAVRSRDAGVWHTPTITVDALSQSQAQAIRTGPEIEAVSPGMRGFFTDGFYQGFSSSIAAREEANHEAMTGVISEIGGGLLVGTDAGFGWMLPGYSIHDELRHFVQAGLTPYEALRAATSDPARAVGAADEFGRIAVGLRADLILVAANPLADVGRVRELSGVMVRGRWLSKGTLERMLDEIAASY